MGNRLHPTATAVWLAVSGLAAAQLSFAAPIFSVTIYDSKSQPWTMSTEDPRVKVLADTTDRTGLAADSQTTNVRKVVEFDSMAPIKISFTMDGFATESYGGRAMNETVRSGLNFNLENIIFNYSPFSWRAFSETTKDHDRFRDGDIISEVDIGVFFGDGIHPTPSHFHKIPGSDPPTHNPPGWELIDFEEGGTTALYGNGGMLNNGGGEFDFNIKVHDIVVTGFQRRFDLFETPIPEPATLALLGLGLAGLGSSRRRRRQA